MSAVDRVVEIVRGIDKLEAEKKQVTAPLDKQIEELRAELSMLIVDRAPGPRPTVAVQARTSALLPPAEHLVALLSRHPGRPYSQLVVDLYGADTPENRNTLRNLVNYMTRKGVIENMGQQGQYRVTDPPERESLAT
jgi:hypothetical protein